MGRAYRLATKGNNDALVLDSSAADTDVGTNLLLDSTGGTNAHPTDEGAHILIEDAGTETAQSNLPFADQTTPAEDHVSWNVWRTTRQTISTNTVTKMTFDYVYHDWMGNANAAADPSKITITVPGIYYLRHNAYYSISGGDAISIYEYAYVHVNGSARFLNYATLGYGGGSGYNYSKQGTKVTEGFTHLHEGDEVEYKVFFYRTAGTLYAGFTGTNIYDGWKARWWNGSSDKTITI
jgi:Uncharacterized protein involved in ubiquinone biosynthesis